MSDPAGGLRLEYLGHCGFRWTTPAGSRIVVDPFRNNPEGQRWFLRPSPPVEADVLVVTHPHFDHDAVDTVTGDPRLVDEVEEIRGDDYFLRTLAGRHSGDYAAAIGHKNLIVVLEVAGWRICHAADNRAEIEQPLRDEIGPIDLLTIAVDDSDHILGATGAERLADLLQPRIVIPTHYHLDGLTDPDAGLGGITRWRALQSTVRDLPGATLDLRKEDLPETRAGLVFASCLALET
jgi:L-ascorbate metabolism protein UlaG (beta-lactamase superfamily)